MANLVDMKLSEADKKAERERWDEPYSGDDYGYGLTIRLDNAQIEKLGLNTEKLDADAVVILMAEGVVTEETSSTVNGKTRRTLAIQLRKLQIAPDEGDAKKVLYGDAD